MLKHWRNKKSSYLIFVCVCVCMRLFCRLCYVRVAEGLVCCTGTLRNTFLYCLVFLWVAQGHCAALYCTVGYSCELHRDIAQHFTVLFVILVSCTGTLRSTLLYCWVFLWVAQGHCAALYCTVWYSCELHEVWPRCSLVLVLQWCFRLCFLSLIYWIRLLLFILVEMDLMWW